MKASNSLIFYLALLFAIFLVSFFIVNNSVYSHLNEQYQKKYQNDNSLLKNDIANEFKVKEERIKIFNVIILLFLYIDLLLIGIIFTIGVAKLNLKNDFDEEGKNKKYYDNLGIGIMQVNKFTKRIYSINKYAKEIIGEKDEEIINKNLHDYLKIPISDNQSGFLHLNGKKEELFYHIGDSDELNKKNIFFVESKGADSPIFDKKTMHKISGRISSGIAVFDNDLNLVFSNKIWDNFYEIFVDDVTNHLNGVLKNKNTIYYNYMSGEKHFVVKFYPEILNDNVVKIQAALENISLSVKISNKLSENENLIRKIFTKTRYPFVTLDENNKIIRANKEFLKLTGFEKNELVNTQFDLLEVSERQKIQKENSNNDEIYAYQVVLRNKTKRNLTVELTRLQYFVDKKKYYFCFIKDISELIRNQLIQSVLLNISNAVNDANSMGELFKEIRKYLSEIINTNNFYIALYDTDTNIISSPLYFDKYKLYTPEPQVLGTGLTAWVIRNKKSLFLPEEKRNEMIKNGELPKADWKSKIWLGTPLRYKSKIVGAMAVQSYTDKYLYDEKDMLLLENVSEQIALAIEKQRAEDFLIEKERRLNAFIENSVDGIIIVDKNLKVNFANKNIQKILNTDSIVKNTHIKELLKLLDSESIIQDIIMVSKTRKSVSEEIKVSISGSVKYLNVNIFKLYDELAITLSDITVSKVAGNRIKSSLKEKDALLKEIHHRVKNNMQLIDSLLHLQSRYIKNPEDLIYFKESRNRVRSMAIVHEILYQTENKAFIKFSEFVRKIVNYTYSSFNMDESKISKKLDIADISVRLDVAVPCALILTELISNVLKYAFPNGKKGTMFITVLGKDDNSIDLVVEDNGIGFSQNIKERDFLGLHLVRDLVEQIKGDIKIISEPNKGTKVVINFSSEV